MPGAFTNGGSTGMRTGRNKDTRWFMIWCAGMAALGVWDYFYLNSPALLQVRAAVVHTFEASALVVVLALVLGWTVGVSMYFLEQSRTRVLHVPATFLLNLIRSIPQIVGILLGYVVLTLLIEREILQDPTVELVCMAAVISIFVFLEVVDLVRERIAYFRSLDFFHAMLCCGIKESRIVNVEILWKNSAAHLFHKLISIFGITIFLQCSIDFILSVGLSTEVSASNFPVTLGSLLAKLDSKQDILAIGMVLSDPGYVTALFTEHLQGVTVAFIIVFTLVCVYQIANGFVKRHAL